MEKKQLHALAVYVDEVVRCYIAAHEKGCHARYAGEPIAQYKDRLIELFTALAEERGPESTIEEIVGGRDVILFGGSDKFEVPKVSEPVIVRTNNHYLWQQDPSKQPDGYPWTDGVYHGAGFGGLLGMFMNVPPKGLKFIAQNCGHPYRSGLKTWAERQGVAYFGYAGLPGDRLEKGVDPKKYEPIFDPLIKICSQPFTGVLAAFHLLTFPIKNLYLTGFTFYEGREHVNRTKEDGQVYRGEHNIEDNRKAMKGFLNDRRCKPDRFLSACL
jgi:hypothetical protein